MVNYLITPMNVLELVDSEYQNSFKIKDTNFYINVQAVSSAGPFVHPLPPDCDQGYCLADLTGVVAFDTFYNNWYNNNAFVYRGIPGCHFSWQRIKNQGILRSEGGTDNPTFTMGNAQPTRWLPTDLTDALPGGVALQLVDQFSNQKSNTDSVPVGIVVKIKVGRTLGIPISYLNPGETVVRGPLNWPSFSIHQVVWLQLNGVLFTNWPAAAGHNNIMPTRPYLPNQRQFNSWWAECQEWLQTMTIVGNNLVYTPAPVRAWNWKNPFKF